MTSVREVGGLGVYLARAVEEGTLDGPTIYGAGAILSVTGGHGDLPLGCQPGQHTVLGAHLIASRTRTSSPWYRVLSGVKIVSDSPGAVVVVLASCRQGGRAACEEAGDGGLRDLRPR